MAEKQIYFQWQNETLVKTIYPLREMKLRNVLEYYMEIDVWKQYKDKKIEQLSGEVGAYHARKKDVITKAVKDYADLEAYFLQDDMRPAYLEKFKTVDDAVMARINTLHTTFKTYYPKIVDPRKESYFISQQITSWEQFRKDLTLRISSQLRRVNVIKTATPNHPNIPVEEQKLKALQDLALPMTDYERANLYSLLSAHGKLAKRKLDFVQLQENAAKQSREVHVKLDPIRQRLMQQESQQKERQAELTRLKTPPDPATVQRYFSTANVPDEMRRQFQEVDPRLLTAINGFHKEVNSILTNIKDDAVKLVSVKTQLANLLLYKQSVENGKAGLVASLKDAHVKAVEAEVDQLNGLKTTFENAKRSPTELGQVIKVKEEEMKKFEETLSGLRKEAGGLQSQMDAFDDILNVTEDKYLKEYTPIQPTVKEMALAKVDEYKASLLEKNQFQLLEEIAQRFKKEPERYPRWLQYMIVHFSGMRYASAHGSWADPKDLYVNLRTSSIDADFKKMDDDTIESLCEEKVATYESSSVASPGVVPPKLAKTTDAKWKEKIAYHLKGLKLSSPYHRRKALLDLRLDEENYEVELMTADQALEALESIKNTLPDWMWKEISALTDLRLKEAKDPNWEKLTPEEQQEKNEVQWGHYREVMNEWKTKNIAGWREEHDRSSKLVVSRAVCNEVAEHIQHLRGHTPDAGLTAKAPWYQRQEREKKIPGNPPPHFIRPFAAKDYTVGASILWLRFVTDEPNPWRVAIPLKTVQGGYGLIPDEYLSKSTGGWSYSMGQPITRHRTRVNEKGQTSKDEQFLRWIHEATVAEVAETAEGMVVLTFETALPYEDPRLSSVGFFKHYDYNILFDGGEDNYNGSFVGYVPENKPNVPTKELDEMLNWDHVLLK